MVNNFFPDRQEKVFAGVIISNVNILTSGHEASLIERAVCSGSEAALYDAWVAVEIDIDNRQNNEVTIDHPIRTCVLFYSVFAVLYPLM